MRVDTFTLLHQRSPGDHATMCPCGDVSVIQSVRESGSVDEIAADHVGIGSMTGRVTVPVVLRHGDDHWTVAEDLSDLLLPRVPPKEES